MLAIRAWLPLGAIEECSDANNVDRGAAPELREKSNEEPVGEPSRRLPRLSDQSVITTRGSSVMNFAHRLPVSVVRE
jgi:hypothetical protein